MNDQFRLRYLDALLLAGGGSSRMGVSKALLPWGKTTLIGTVIAALRPLFRQVIVVARDQSGLTGLGVEMLVDQRPERGPLVGLATGLAASDAPWCFVVGCDMPFLHPAVIGRMAENLEGCDILIPTLESRLQPLHAFYSRNCLPKVTEILDGGETSLRALFPRCQVRTMPATDFADIDPDLLSFADVDTREEYQTVRKLMLRSQQPRRAQ